MNKRNILKVFYLYYDDGTFQAVRDSIFDTYCIKDCSVYFENKIIESLHENDSFVEYEYCGVFSHRLREKITLHKNLPSGHLLKNYSQRIYDDRSFRDFCNKKWHRGVEVISPFSYAPHDIFSTHGGGNVDLRGTFVRMLEEMGFDNPRQYVDTDYSFPLYGNHYVMKNEIYTHYITEYLTPAMRLLHSSSPLHTEALEPAYDSHNSHKRALSKHLGDKFGFYYYPKIPFLLERLVNVFLKKEKLYCEGF